MAKSKLRWLPKRHYNDLTLLFIRLVAGGFMLTHGIPKFNRLLSGNIAFTDPLGLGEEFSLILVVFAEFVCASLVVIGMFTRLAVIPLIVTMAVAAFLFHGEDSFSKQELPLMYLAFYLILMVKGPGELSVDKVLNRK